MKRLWHCFTLLCILAGLLTISALAQAPEGEDAAKEVFGSEPAVGAYGPIWDWTEPAAQVYDDQDSAALLAETPIYSTMAAAVNAIKTGLANHVGQIQFFLSDDLVGAFINQNTSVVKARLEELRTELWDSVVAYDPAQPSGGDYWTFQMGIERSSSYGYITSGSTVRYTNYRFTFKPIYYASKGEEEILSAKLDALMPTLVSNDMSDYEKVRPSINTSVRMSPMTTTT